MKTKKRLPLRMICVLLALCLAAIAASPVAAALTPEQEQRLQTSQRSLNNPTGGFQVPGAVSSFWWLHPDTFYAIQQLAGNILEQFETADADPEAWRDIFAYAPVIKPGDKLPPRKDLFFEANWLAVGEIVKSMVPYVLLEGLKDVYLALQETETPDVYQVIMFYSSRWGKSYWTPLNLYYNQTNGAVYGRNGGGMLGFGIDYVSTKQMMTTAPYSYQRELGFSIFFDMIGPLVAFHLDTVRFPFEYGGKDWMVQVWKGSYYLVSNGGEIGLYEKPKDRPLFWDGSDTELGMSMQIYKDGKLDVDYPETQSWWLCGVHYGNPLRLPVVSADKLRMTGSIRFKDQAMLDAFLASFEENKPANMTGAAEGLLFQFDWQAG